MKYFSKNYWAMKYLVFRSMVSWTTKYFLKNLKNSPPKHFEKHFGPIGKDQNMTCEF